MEADDSALAVRLIDDLIRENPHGKRGGLYGLKLDETRTGLTMLGRGPDEQAAVVAVLLERLIAYDREASQIRAERGHKAPLDERWDAIWTPRQLLAMALRGLLGRRLPLEPEHVRRLTAWLARSGSLPIGWFPLGEIATAVESFAEHRKVGYELRGLLQESVDRLLEHDGEPECCKITDRLIRVMTGGPIVRLMNSEAWSDVAVADLDALEPAARRDWQELLAHCQGASGKMTRKWLKEAAVKVEAIGFDDFKARVLRWFPLVDRPKPIPDEPVDPWAESMTHVVIPPHAELLKGLAWCCGLRADGDLARALRDLALSTYRTIPGKGARLPKIGNACVAALGLMPNNEAVGALALLKARIKPIPAQKEIEKALATAAARAGLPAEHLEELAVPAYGMEEVGRRRAVLGDYSVELVVEGQDSALRWSKTADGKPLKSVPAAVKKEWAGDVKDLQAAVKDVGKMLTAQRDRIDGLFLARKTWPLDAWRAHYLDHPLVGTIARRLIWHFETDGASADGAWLDAQLVDSRDRPLENLGAATTVALCHPIGRPLDDVSAWRDWLDRHQVQQPFKQAHREVYVLTDAERNTRVYSNRFAAHLVRQHQFHALCGARGWRNQLRLMVSATYPPTSKELPQWGVRAEFWVEGAGDVYGRDTNETGTYLYLATDQVRFYELAGAGRNRADAEPVPLERIPALVLSEVLRDVDLFVGVASVGNDPSWADGGPDRRHVQYWTDFSFGDLSANGQTRKAVLEQLVPRLKIAPRCTFTDRFLVVRGDLRTYKIHLGSGNIVMEPNDQYLCIVAKLGTNDPAGGVFLPFEGDNTLSIILSKALLLADDANIRDSTIVSQIRR